MSLDAISSSDTLSNNTEASFDCSIVKAGVVLGIFTGVMAYLNNYLGNTQAVSNPNDHDGDDSNSVLQNRVTISPVPVQIPEEVQVALQIVTEEIVE